jgi:hypothetical protein
MYFVKRKQESYISTNPILDLISLQENVIFLTQKVMAHDTREVNFVVSSITMCNTWCSL